MKVVSKYGDVSVRGQINGRVDAETENGKISLENDPSAVEGIINTKWGKISNKPVESRSRVESLLPVPRNSESHSEEASAPLVQFVDACISSLNQ